MAYARSDSHIFDLSTRKWTLQASVKYPAKAKISLDSIPLIRYSSWLIYLGALIVTTQRSTTTWVTCVLLKSGLDSLQDERMLLKYAASPPEQQPYICGWVISGITCGMPVIGDLFSIHLRDQHGVVGGGKVKFRCEWTKCGMMMNKESISHHVTDIHLRYRFICSECNAVFSRRHTLNCHVQQKHCDIEHATETLNIMSFKDPTAPVDQGFDPPVLHCPLPVARPTT